MVQPSERIPTVTLESQRRPQAAPPTRPTAGDKALLAFAQSAELAVHDLYTTALEKGGYGEDEAAMIALFGEHHLAYAQSIGGLLGADAPNSRNDDLYRQFASSLTGGASSNRILQTLENTLATTHTDVLGQLEGVDGATLVASIIMVEARHAAAFGTLPSLSLTSALDNAALSLAPAAATAPTDTTDTTETTVSQ
jgi:hypothetical protein